MKQRLPSRNGAHATSVAAPVRAAATHRSAIVNLDRVKEIEPLESGDARLHLINGRTVPVSRRYRQGLKGRLG